MVSGTKITMETPHLSGYTPDQRPYELWAKTATQDITDPDHVDLNDFARQGADGGQIDPDCSMRAPASSTTSSRQLDLHKDIFLQTSTGYEARLNQAFVDIGKGTVASDEHVDVKLTNGTLTADRLRITDGGEVIRFEGNVVMHLDKLAMTTPRPACAAPSPRRQSRHARLRTSPPTQNDLHDEFFPRNDACGAPFGAGGAAARVALVAPCGRAQSTMQGVPNAMQGFSQNRDQPIQIEAASLEMRDKKKEATFSGNVKVVQGDTTMTSKTLVVFYDSEQAATGPPRRAAAKAGAKSAPMQSATPGPGGSSSIKRLEARGNVVVTQKDQVVTGETAVFDTKANLITMLGGVVLTQCKNVLRGDRLVVDMTTGVSRVESDSGRVQALLQAGSGGIGQPGHARLRRRPAIAGGAGKQK